MNSKPFILSIQDEAGQTTLLDGYAEQEGKYIDIYMGQTENGTREDTCLHFVMGDYDQLLLADLLYRKTCDIRGVMEERTGTKRMLMGAMKYLIKVYPHLNEVSLSDIAQKYNTRVYLTPKRLLLGKKGWYEEYFGAVPILKTQFLIRHLPNITPEQRAMIEKASWGTASDLHEISDSARKLIQSDWTIPHKTIEAYPVKIKRLRSTQQGGGKNKRTLKKYEAHCNRAHLDMCGFSK